VEDEVAYAEAIIWRPSFSSTTSLTLQIMMLELSPTLIKLH